MKLLPQCFTAKEYAVTLLGALYVFFLGIFSGVIGSVVGFASVATIPLLIFLGLSPHVAIATNRMAILGMIMCCGYKYHQQKMIDYRVALPIGIAALCGSFIGAQLLITINEEQLLDVVGIFTIALLAFFIFDPKKGLEKVEHRIRKRHAVTGIALSFVLGIYGGFYGAGVAMFLSLVLVFLFRKTFLEAAATRIVAMLCLSGGAAAIYAAKGLIHYPYMIVQCVGMGIGGWVGAHYAARIGNVWIRRIFIVVAAFIAVHMIYDL